VCAADIARTQGDDASRARYLGVADSWRSQVKGWTVTTNGPYSPKPYFLRLTKDGKPDSGTTYNVGDSGPDNVDQRAIVDPSFLELVRLGVLAPGDPAVTNSLKVVDARLGFTPGTPTLSAPLLGWAHGQYVRLAWSIDEHRSISTPSIVACRYTPCGR
jgi:GH15 family glucan-1,4-alpha-glucosidase